LAPVPDAIPTRVDATAVAGAAQASKCGGGEAGLPESRYGDHNVRATRKMRRAGVQAPTAVTIAIVTASSSARTTMAASVSGAALEWLSVDRATVRGAAIVAARRCGAPTRTGVLVWVSCILGLLFVRIDAIEHPPGATPRHHPEG